MFLQLAGIKFGLDLKGGFELIYEVKPPPNRNVDVEDMMKNTMEVLGRRVDALGVRDIAITKAGRTTILVDLAGGTAAEKEAVHNIISKMGVLEFKLVKKYGEGTGPDWERQVQEEIEKVKKRMLEIDAENAKRALRNEPPLRYEEQVHKMYIYDDKGKKTGEREIICENKPESVVSGSELSGAHPTTDQYGRPAVGFTFHAVGARQFYELTSKNIGRQLAVVLDGIVYSAPVIRSGIYGNGIIEGDFSREEVQNLVLTLRSGALAGKPELVGEYQMGPALGERSIKLGTYAIIFSMLAVLAFMAAYYLAAGIIADISMIVNLILIAGSLAASGATFTLPGLAGLVLTIGMAVDANILIFERIREERIIGKSLRQALSTGFGRAFWTIFDSNLTTLITALILIPIGTGPVRGFGVVLAIGIVCTMFSALLVAQTILNVSVNKRVIREMKMLHLIKNPRFNFVRWMPLAVVVSAVLVIGGITLFAVRGDEKYGLEFTGGVLFQVGFHKPTPVSDVRAKAVNMGDLSNVSVTAVYTGVAGEDASKGEAYQFLIKGRVAKETQKSTTGKESSSVSPPQEPVEVRVQSSLKKLFGDFLVPEPFPEIDEGTYKKALAEGKLLLDVVTPKNLQESEIEKEIKTTMAKAGFPETVVEKLTVDEKLKDKYLKFRLTVPNVDLTKTTPEQALKTAHSALKEMPNIKLPEPFLRIQAIGTSVAYNLKSKAIIALALAFIAIIIYVGIRFELIYGVAAVVALVHDVLVALGIVMLFDMLGIMEIKIDLNVIAAFLTIVGYSVNDTIVIFDRIRETLRRRRFQTGAPVKFSELVNDSLNATLSRTIITSGTTLIALVVLLAFGIENLQGFTFTMLIGVIVGTYSSVYVASALVILSRAEKREKERAAREEKEAEEERRRLAEEVPYTSEDSEESSDDEESDENEGKERLESPDMESYSAAEAQAQKEEHKKKKRKRR